VLASVSVFTGEMIIYQSPSEIAFSLKFIVPIFVIGFIASPFILARMK